MLLPLASLDTLPQVCICVCVGLSVVSQALRRLRSALYTYTMLWPRNVTLPLNYFDACMGTCRQHNVDFIGGDFKMSAFCTFGDMFADPEFSAPGNSFLWGTRRWRRRIVSARGFSSCRSDHMSGVWIYMAAISSTMQTWHLDLTTPWLAWHLYDPGYVQPLSHAPTAPCLYHPCGNTSCAISHYRQEKCQYCSCGNSQSCWCSSSCRNWPPKPRALVLPMVKFGQSKPDGHGHLGNADSDLMHHQYRLSLLQWNPGSARRNPTNIVSAVCGKFHAVILQEASDHVPHISDQFIAYTGNTDLAILLNKDAFEPDPIVFTFKVDSTSKGTCGMVLLIVRGLLRRPSLSGSPTVTFCSVCRG